jgi:hypothetical protein
MNIIVTWNQQNVRLWHLETGHQFRELTDGGVEFVIITSVCNVTGQRDRVDFPSVVCECPLYGLDQSAGRKPCVLAICAESVLRRLLGEMHVRKV